MGKPRFFTNTKWQANATRYLAQITNEGTRTAYRRVLMRFFGFVKERHGHEVTPDKITPADIEAFLQQPIPPGHHHAGQQKGAARQNTILTALRSFYSYAQRDQVEFRGKLVPMLRTTPPTAHIKWRRCGEVDRDMTEDEITRFFAAISRETRVGLRDYALFYTLLSTGRRKAEIARLTRGDIEQATFVSADGSMRAGWLYTYTGKGRVSPEQAEMPQPCIEAIKAFHASLGRDFASMDTRLPLFCGVATTGKLDRAISLYHVDDRFRRYAGLAGLPANVCVHSLRWENCWARLQATGNNWERVQREIGWADIAMVARYARRRRKKEAGDPTANQVAARFAHM